MQNSLTRKPIEIKIATVVAVAVLLHQSEIATLETALKEMTADTPDFLMMNSPLLMSNRLPKALWTGSHCLACLNHMDSKL